MASCARWSLLLALASASIAHAQDGALYDAQLDRMEAHAARDTGCGEPELGTAVRMLRASTSAWEREWLGTSPRQRACEHS